MAKDLPSLDEYGPGEKVISDFRGRSYTDGSGETVYSDFRGSSKFIGYGGVDVTYLKPNRKPKLGAGINATYIPEMAGLGYTPQMGDHSYQPQMGDFFSDLSNLFDQASGDALEKAKEAAIATAMNELLARQDVQDAIKQSAIEQYKSKAGEAVFSASSKIASFIGTYKWWLLGGSTGLLGLGLILRARKK